MNISTFDTNQINNTENKIEMQTSQIAEPKNEGDSGGYRGREGKSNRKFPINIINKFQRSKTPIKEDQHMLIGRVYSNYSWIWLGIFLRDAIIDDCELWNLKTPIKKGDNTHNGDKAALKRRLKALKDDTASTYKNLEK